MTEQERTIHLRIKIKSLADEARTIRAEAKKVSGMVKWELNHHRTSVVRPHARLSLLAYGLLRGVPYRAIEHSCYELPNWEKIRNLASRFGGEEVAIDAWISEAKEHALRPAMPVRLTA